MRIKKARLKAGLTQERMALLLGIPKRTIENWDAGKAQPPRWVENMIIENLENLNKKNHKIRNTSIKNYAQICKEFSHDTREWLRIKECTYYVTNHGSWVETCDNECNGVDVHWAFGLTDDEIEKRAGEELYEKLMEEIYLAICEEWEIETLELIYKKFDF